MNRYILIRRLRGPAFLLLVGVIALLAQFGILSWGRSWRSISSWLACCCWPSAPHCLAKIAIRPLRIPARLMGAL